MKIGSKGIELIKKWEGFRSKPYEDIVNIWTIGYGNTYYRDGRKVTLKDRPLTEPEAYALMVDILDRDFVPKIDKLIHVDVGQNMFDACCSLAYNIGSGAFGKSTLLKKVNSLDFGGAAAEFEKWAKAGGKVVQGLLNRRREEKALFEKDIKRNSN